MKRWQRRLRSPNSARHGDVVPIVPVLDDWMRSRSKRTFRLTQVLYGHRCFRGYQYMIWEVVTPGCWHAERRGTARSTAWRSVRLDAGEEGASAFVGWDLSLHAIVPGMAGSDRVCRAVATFYGQVMQRKQEAERGCEEGIQTRGRLGRERRLRRAGRTFVSPQAGVNAARGGNPG
ncbi:uncharacterized protein LOC143220366 [Lasioglossum baleicum]|uniref:uncharacterized protein LOC143220366 n=1 Tax=Lasioglossum baleicum TaxID=434251 RepID=UPI003FCE04C6